MFEKCITCQRIGETCVPNLMLLPFKELIQWCTKRQKHLEWTSQTLSEKSKVPIGTINRIKAGDYDDCKYSTMRSMLIALIGGTTDEFSCTEQVTKELEHMEKLEAQAAKLAACEAENAKMKDIILHADEQHRADIRLIRNEYQKQIDFLVNDVEFLRSLMKKG